MKKLRKNRLLCDRFILLAAILARWWQPVVASGVALVPLHRAMRLVSYRCTATASETAGKYDAFSSFFCLHANPVISRGNTVQILTQWRLPVASVEALDHPHRAMRVVLYRRTATAIEMVDKVDIYCIIIMFSVTLAAVGAILIKQLPDGGV